MKSMSKKKTEPEVKESKPKKLKPIMRGDVIIGFKEE